VPSSLYIFHLYSLLIALSGKNSSPCGTSSLTSSANPSTFPSLYTLNVYVTISLFATSTGSFVCVYTYFPSLSIEKTGTLFVISLSFTAVINFLKLKSNF